jgi:hypothetical protein
VAHFGATVLGVDNNVADFDVKRNPLFAIFIETTWPYCDDLALLWLFLSGIWDYQTRSGGLLGF